MQHSDEDIQAQWKLLNTHRKTLHQLLVQRATHTAAYAPPALLSGIEEARTEIARIKAILRSWGEQVVDIADDTDESETTLSNAGPVIHPPPITMTQDTLTEMRYGPRVIKASDQVADREEDQLGQMAVATAAIVVVVLYSLSSMVRSLIAGENISLLAVAGLLAAILLGVWKVYRSGRAWISTQRDREGVHQVVEELRSSLDNRWSIYYNLQLPGSTTDLDVVLVGPGGVWVVEVKTFRGAVRYRAGHWERQAGRTWRALAAKHDPKRVNERANALRDFLARQGIECEIHTAIALAKPVPAKDVADWSMTTITDKLGHLS